MAKVVYLMGAGASVGTRGETPISFTVKTRFADGKELISHPTCANITFGLPLVTEIPQRLKYIANLLRETPFAQFSQVTIGGKSFDEAKSVLVSALEWLAKESAKHATIDTFAKKLYLKGSDDFDKVEKLLSIYFIIEQHINRPDNRYDTFLASLLTKDLTLPDDVVVLTWNYDSQFEIAYREFNREYPRKIGMCSEYDDEYRSCPNPQIFKLNGTASYAGLNAVGEWCNSDAESITTLPINVLLGKYFSRGNSSMLTFAWDRSRVEGSKKSNWFWEQMQSKVANAECLVVIGYTFPYFNREVDRRLFELMPRLKQIYVQAPNAVDLCDSVVPVLSYNQVSGRNLNNNITPVSNCEQFYLPNQL